MSEPVFVDASAWVAITNRNDRNRGDAVKIFQRLLSMQTALVTTNWTAYDALTIVKSRLGFSQAERLWQRITSRAVVELVAVDEQIETDALELFWRYQDKTWGVVDCSSLVVMEAVGSRSAFAYDRHFVEASRQFGFTVVKR
ncbi:MAG: PIN domain-containing protein [Deltaproteobacteria bacterium]|nr:PIN domain-containing protein [Deltaproteobacteria bacterium]